MENEEKSKVYGGSIVLAVIYWITSAIFIAIAILMHYFYEKYISGTLGFAAAFAAFFFCVHGLRYFCQKRNDKYRFKYEEKDGRRVRKSLKRGIYLGVIRLMFWSYCVLAYKDMIEYMAKCPRIYAESTITVHTGDELSFDDLARVNSMTEEEKIKKNIYFYTSETKELSSYVSDDNTTLFIGENKESFKIILSATTLEQSKKIVTIIVE